MSHAVFRTAQIMPINTQMPASKNSSSKPPLLPPIGFGKSRKFPVMLIRASVPPPVADGGGSTALLERCLAVASPVTAPTAALGGVEMNKKQLSSIGATTLEKPKFEIAQKKKSKRSPELATGGGGGDIGKIIHNGGGDGGDDGGDDDDYFGDFDEGDEGDEGGLFRRRMVFQELFDRKFVDAVLNEWQKTMMDLPAGLRQAYEMGLVSSAQLVKYLSINARPTTVRTISRALPQGMSRAFIGRMIADPSFLFRLLLEQAATIGSATWLEVQNRKHRLKDEWDLALVNVLTASACNAVIVWSLAPCRSYGSTFRFDLQNTLQKLPNNIFEKSYPMREFDLQKRIHAFLYKAGEFALVGSIAGAAQGALSNLCASKKKERLSVTIPSTSANALGYGAYLGVFANLRYQLLCGADRALLNYFDVIGVSLFLGAALRIMNVHLGEVSRLAWLGIEAVPLVNSDNLPNAYSRPADSVTKDGSNWFISKNAIVSGLGLLGMGQPVGEKAAPKGRRKRVVKKKVASS